MNPEELRGRLSVINNEESPLFGVMTYRPRRTEKKRPLLVGLYVRPSASGAPRIKYQFVGKVGRFAIPLDHQHRLDLN